MLATLDTLPSAGDRQLSIERPNNARGIPVASRLVREVEAGPLCWLR
jgi:hypothetical protein